jgi:hypothetical protein
MVDSLLSVFGRIGFDHISLQSIDNQAMFLTAYSTPGTMTIKVRPVLAHEQKKTYNSRSTRETEALKIAAQRFKRMEKATPFPVNTLFFDTARRVSAPAAQIKIGNQLFFALGMDHIVANGTFAQNWVQRYMVDNNGDCPDDVRELASMLLLALSRLHAMCLALNSFQLNSIGFLPGPKLHPVFTDLSGAVVGKPNRQYISFEANDNPPNASPNQTEDFTVQKVSFAQMEKSLNGIKSLNLLSPTELKKLPPPHFPVQIWGAFKDTGCDKTNALENCRYADLESVSKVVVQLITGADDHKIESLMDKLKLAESEEEFATALDFPLHLQRTTMPRFLGGIRNLMDKDPEKRQSADTAFSSKPFQFVILTEKQTNESLNGGIPVPAGPTIPDKATATSRMAPDLAIVQAQNTPDNDQKGKQGLCVKAKQAIQKGEFVSDYAGEYARYPTPFSVHSLGIRQGISCLKAHGNCQLTLNVYILERAIGHLLNSSRVNHDKKKPGNVYLDRSKMYIDANGNLKVPMFASRDISKDEELLWDYDFKAGIFGSLTPGLSNEDVDEDKDKNKESTGTCI